MIAHDAAGRQKHSQKKNDCMHKLPTQCNHACAQRRHVLCAMTKPGMPILHADEPATLANCNAIPTGSVPMRRFLGTFSATTPISEQDQDRVRHVRLQLANSSHGRLQSLRRERVQWSSPTPQLSHVSICDQSLTLTTNHSLSPAVKSRQNTGSLVLASNFFASFHSRARTR